MECAGKKVYALGSQKKSVALVAGKKRFRGVEILKKSREGLGRRPPGGGLHVQDLHAVQDLHLTAALL